MSRWFILVTAVIILVVNFFLWRTSLQQGQIMIDPKMFRRFGVYVKGSNYKEVILFVGGWLSGLTNKQCRIACCRLAEDHPNKRVIFVEPPGVGATSWYTSFVGPWWKLGKRRRVIEENFAFLADAELRALREIGVEKIWFVGFSMGANIVAKLALKAPEHGIEVMGVISNSGILKRYESPRELRKIASSKKSLAELQAIRKESQDLEVRRATESMRRLYWEIFRDVLGRCFILRRSKLMMMLAYTRMLAQTELFFDLRQLSRRGVSVYFIVGGEDRLSDRDEHTKVWRLLQREKNDPTTGRLGNLTFREVPGGTHMGIGSDPSIYVPIISGAIEGYTH